MVTHFPASQLPTTLHTISDKPPSKFAQRPANYYKYADNPSLLQTINHPDLSR